MVLEQFGKLKMSIDIQGLDEAEKFLKELGTTSKTILSQTLNTLAKESEEKAIKLITGELSFSNSLAKSKFTIENSTPQKLVSTVRTPSAGTSLANFDAIQLWHNTEGKRYRAGVSVNVKKRRTVLKKAFTFTGKNGNKLVAIRKGKGKNNFDVLYGPSISQAFNTFHDPLAKDVEDHFADRFFKQLDDLL